MADKGKFITFEGGEGTGKSTQARLLADRLKAAGHDAVVTREPGGTPLAERIRDLILADRPQEPDAEFLLFAAARAEHLTATIKPALNRGTWVICDRFIDSTRVYQGDIFKVRADLIAAIEHLTVAPWYPDLTIVLDLAPDTALKRASERGELSRYDQAHARTHAALRAGFLRIAKAEPGRCAVVDASAAAERVASDIWRVVQDRLQPGAT